MFELALKIAFLEANHSKFIEEFIPFIIPFKAYPQRAVIDCNGKRVTNVLLTGKPYESASGGTLVVFPMNAEINHTEHENYIKAKKKNQRCLSFLYPKGKTIDETVDYFVEEIYDNYKRGRIDLPIEGIGYSVGGIIGSEVMERLNEKIKDADRYKKKEEGSEDKIISQYTAMNSGRSISHLVKKAADIPDVGLWLLGMTNINLEDNIRALEKKGIKVNIISAIDDEVIPIQLRPFNDQQASIGDKVWSLIARPLQTMLVAMVVVAGSCYDSCYDFTKSKVCARVAALCCFFSVSLLIGPLVGLCGFCKNLYEIFCGVQKIDDNDEVIHFGCIGPLKCRHNVGLDYILGDQCDLSEYEVTEIKKKLSIIPSEGHKVCVHPIAVHDNTIAVTTITSSSVREIKSAADAATRSTVPSIPASGDDAAAKTTRPTRS